MWVFFLAFTKWLEFENVHVELDASGGWEAHPWVSITCLSVFLQEGRWDVYLLLHFSYLFEILLWHLYLAFFYAVIQFSQSFFLYNTFRCYSKEHFYTLSWVSFRKSFYVDQWPELLNFNIIQCACNIAIILHCASG